MTAVLETELRGLWREGDVRAGAAFGDVTLARLGGWNGRWMPLATGPAVTAYHARLADARRWPSQGSAQLPLPRRRGRLLDGEIGERAMLFACLGGEVARDELQAIVRLTQAEADLRSGLLETVTHDDAGVMLRLGLPADAAGLRAAQDLGRVLRARARESGLRPGLGLAVGLVFRAAVSSGGPDAWTVHGRAVNAAAKLAKRGPGFGLDESAQRRLEAAPRRRPSTRLRPETGRDAEVESILAHLREPRPRAGLADVRGEPGIGKSHLLARLKVQAWAGPVAQVAARPQHSLDAFWLWARAVQACAEQDPAILSVIEALPAPQRSAVRQLVLGGREREPTFAPDAAAAGLLDVLRVLGRQRSLLLLDDLQWADAASLQLLARVAAGCPGLAIVAARREYVDGAAEPPQGATLTLQLRPLDGEALRAAIVAATGRDLGERDLQEVARLSGGNPLCAVQLVLAARETGAWVTGGISAILEARLAGLDPHDRAALRILAVAERPLPSADIAAVARRHGASIEEAALHALAARAFLGRDTAGGFQLAHQLLGGPVCAQAPPSLLSSLHAGVARRLARARREGRLMPGPGEIARHWLAADAAARAAAGFLRDGQRSVEEGAYGSALHLLDAAEAALADPTRAGARRALLHAGRSHAHYALGQLNQAEAAANAALAAVDLQLGAGDPRRGRWRRLAQVARGGSARLPSRLGDALLRASMVRAEVGTFTGDLAAIVGGNLTSARIAGDAAAKARGLCVIGLMAGLLGAGPIARRAYAGAQAMTTGSAAAYCYASEAVWRLAGGRWERAAEAFETARRLMGESIDPHLTEAVVALEALSAQMRGEPGQAKALFEALLASARDRGNRLHEAWGLYGQAMPMIHDGRAGQALPLVDEAQTILAHIGDRQSALICHGLRAQACARLADVDAALDAVEAGVAFAGQVPPTNFGSLEGFAGPATAVLTVLGDPALPPSQAHRARSLAPPSLKALAGYAQVFPMGRPRLLAARGRWARLRGDATASVRLAAKSAAVARRLGMAGEAAGNPWLHPLEET